MLLSIEDFEIFRLVKIDLDVPRCRYIDNTYVDNGVVMRRENGPIRPRMTASRNNLHISQFTAIQNVLIQNPFNPDKLKELRSEFAALLKKED